MSGHRSDMLKLMRVLKKKGCVVTKLGSGHWRIITPNGTRLTTSFSPRTPGALRSTLRDLRKAGVDV